MTADDIPEGMVVTFRDIQKAHFCAAGARRWFEAHDLDFLDFTKNGIAATTLFATDDAFALRVLVLKLAGETPNG